VHGSAPDIADRELQIDRAFASAILMLRYLSEREAADRIEAALLGVFAAGQVRNATLAARQRRLSSPTRSSEDVLVKRVMSTE